MVGKYGNGLINTTWLVTTPEQKFILQKINKNIFKSPADVAYNIDLISNYLQANFSEYLFTAPLKTIDGNSLLAAGENYYRVFPFVENSHTIDTAEKPPQAYEAAKQFGKFNKVLSGFDAGKLKITIPDFHNLTLRYSRIACI